MSEMIARLLSPTPRFFKKVQMVGATLIAVGGALLKLKGVPVAILGLANHFLWIGPIIALTAQLACDKAPEATQQQAIAEVQDAAGVT